MISIAPKILNLLFRKECFAPFSASASTLQPESQPQPQPQLSFSVSASASASDSASALLSISTSSQPLGESFSLSLKINFFLNLNISLSLSVASDLRLSISLNLSLRQTTSKSFHSIKTQQIKNITALTCSINLQADAIACKLLTRSSAENLQLIDESKRSESLRNHIETL